MGSSLRLETSDDAPSDRSSVYDASISADTAAHAEDSSEETINDNPNHAAGRKWNTRVRLFTIRETNSCNGLKPAPSHTTLQAQFSSIQQPQPSHPVSQRQICRSLDEKALHGLHQKAVSEDAEGTSGPASDCSESASSHWLQTPILKPIKPPFDPPKRVNTPEGVLSWPVARVQAAGQDEQAPPGSGNAMIRFLTRKPSRRPSLRRLILRKKSAQCYVGEGQQTQPTGPPVIPPRGRPWAPPRSGHTTFRYGGLEDHPFNSAPAARVATLPGESATQPTPTIRIEPSSPAEDATLHHTCPGSRPDRPCERHGAPRTEPLSPSQRALSELSSNAVCVDSIHVESVRARRTSSVPDSQFRSPTPSHASPRPVSYPTSTVRTVELLEAFPPPPSRSRARPSIDEMAQGPASTPPRLSLFPKTSRARIEKEQATQHKKPLDATLQGVVEHAKRGRGVEHHPANGQPSFPSEPGFSQELPAGSADFDDGSADDAHGPSVRGERSSRYRVSGTPIYASDAASLQSFDRRTEDAEAEAASRQSSRSGSSRYFSASSTALTSQASPSAPNAVATAPAVKSPSRVVRSERSSQRNRAVANGALRFGSRDREQTVEGQAAAMGMAELRRMVPVTVTSYGRLCRHRLARIEQDYDGTCEGQMKLDGDKQQGTSCWRCRARRAIRRARSALGSCLGPLKG